MICAVEPAQVDREVSEGVEGQRRLNDHGFLKQSNFIGDQWPSNYGMAPPPLPPDLYSCGRLS